MTETERRLRGLERQKTAVRQLGGVDVADHIADVYKPLHADIEAQGHQYYNLKGGRGSGKSSFVALEIVAGIMADKSGESNGIVFRRTANTLRDSVYSQIAWAIDELGAADLWRGNVSPMGFSYFPTGAQILFRGLDDPSKLKSIKPRQGYFRYAWIEEFSEMPGENFNRSIMQSVVRSDAVTVFRTYNPPISRANWVNLFILQPDDRAETLHTTYLDLPPAWLGRSFMAEAERLQSINPKAYQHEYLGEPTGDAGQVFSNVTARTITDDEMNGLQYVYEGVDFGFSADPAVFMRVAFDRKHDTLYLLDEIYKMQCTNAQLADEIKARGYDLADGLAYLPMSREASRERARIICDSAEPKSIADLKGAGLNTLPCKKFPGSVNYGIRWLQSRAIVIDPERTPQAAREFLNYEYVRTKDGDILADVPDKDNHTIDATRYALDGLINSRKYSA